MKKLFAALLVALIALPSFGQTYKVQNLQVLGTTTLTTPLPIASGGTNATTATGATSQLQYLQGATGSVARTLTNKFQDFVAAKDFGVKCDGVTDDTTAIQNSINALPTTGGADMFPAGVCLVSATINIPNASTLLVGQGIGVSSGTVIKSTNNAIKILNFTGAYSGLSGFVLDYSTTPVAGATALYSSGANNIFQSFFINKAYNGVEVTSGSAQYFSNFQIFNYVNVGFLAHGINDVYINTFILNAGNATNGALGGMRYTDQTEAMTVSNGDILLGVYSITTDASVYSQGTRPAYNKFTQVYFDSSALGTNFNNSVEFGFTNCWFSGGRSGAGYAGVTLNTTDSFRFQNTEFFNNGGAGALITANAKRTVFVNNVFESNSVTAGNGVAHGLSIAAGATDFIVQGNIFHNGLYTGQQGWGVIVNAGASDNYIIKDNNANGNFTGGISDGGTGTNKWVSNNLPYTLTPGAFSTVNGNTITTGTGTLTLGAGKTLTANNTLTLAGTDATTLTFQGTDTYVGRATTDTLTNKTFDTAGAGNVLKINGVTISANTGTGSNVLATSPTLVTPVLGVATGTSLNLTGSASAPLLLNGSMTGGATLFAQRTIPAFQSDVTSIGVVYSSAPSTAAAAFTLGSLHHFRVDDVGKGAGSTITTQVGFMATNLANGTFNRGFQSDVSSGANKFNFYASGSADNAFAGNVRIGSTTAPVATLDVTGSISASTQYNVNGTLLYSATAPTISSGFGTSPSVASNNGSATFRVNVGTGGTATSGVVGLPTASNGWNCHVNEFNPTATALLSVTVVTASTTTSVTVTNDLLSTGAATAWQASQVLIFQCAAY